MEDLKTCPIFSWSKGWTSHYSIWINDARCPRHILVPNEGKSHQPRVPRQVFLESWGVSGQSNIIIGPQNAGLIEVDNYANRKYDTATPGICLPTWRVLFSWSTSTMLICWNYHYGMTQDLYRATNYTRWFHTLLTFTTNKFEDHANSALLVVRRCIDGKLRRKNELTLLCFECVLHCMHQILP